MGDFKNIDIPGVNTFNQGMYKDVTETNVGDGLYTHARNAVNNSDRGDLLVIGNEPSNKFCNKVPYLLMGSVHLLEDKWLLFSTDNTNSEIGIFDESECIYTKLINAPCLNFNTNNLITGAVKRNFDCTRSVYFDDGLNPSRVLNIDKLPYKEKASTGLKKDECKVTEYTTELDCEALRLASLVDTPCATLSKSASGGILQNGSYQVAVAYTINQQRVTDYLTLSNVQSLFSHEGGSGALELELSNLDTDFDEIEVVILATIAENTTARRLGFYSTHSKKIYISSYSDQLPAVDISNIIRRSPAFDKSDAMYELNGYLIRSGVYTKPDFNYQPQANNIVAKWVAVEAPADYYIKGGNLTSYMRDEVYPFFIRWVYNTGEKSASYHIPGRKANSKDKVSVAGLDAVENAEDKTPAKAFQVYDTSQVTSKSRTSLGNGLYNISEGLMSYWESTELYPDNNPQVWGELCGKPIRHHKFPDSCTIHTNNTSGTKINILGVKFEGITHPVGFDGKPISSIVGYEILRGSREGNKSIVAKGLLNNMREYDIDKDVTTRKGLFSNYPFNDLRKDPYLSKNPVKGGCEGRGYVALDAYRKDMFSFHSPETNFRDPYLSPYEVKVHGEVYGNVEGYFEPVFKHPKHRLLTDAAVFVSGMVGFGVGLLAIKGKTTTTVDPARTFRLGNNIIAGVAAGTLVGDPIPTNLGSLGSGTLTSSTEGAVPSSAKDQILLNTLNKVFTYTFWMGQGMEQAIRVIREMLPYIQYAYQYNAHGFYANFKCARKNQIRRKVVDAQYINPYLQEFGSEHRINNLFRSRFVALKLENELQNPTVEDNSRVTIGQLGYYDTPTKKFSQTTSAFYASLKQHLPAQYGQIDGVRQVLISTCVEKTQPVLKFKHTSAVYFGGDIYINRYTEKNTFFFFNDWLYDLPNGMEFNYMDYVNIPYPRYWVDTTAYDVSKLISPFVKTAQASSFGAQLGNIIGGLVSNSSTAKLIGSIIGGVTGAVTAGSVSFEEFKNKVLPNDYAHLDRRKSECSSKLSFGIKSAYFYLFSNGVRDFFVESEINLAHRDWGESLNQRFYDDKNNTDLTTLFRSDIIKSGNYYKYDYSLSVSKLFNNTVTWGNVLSRDYDPEVSEKCYSYYPKRVMYSLPQTQELKKDNWKVFLANNYADFNSSITAIKAVNQTGVMMLYKNASPTFFTGVDQLQTTQGIKITVGDGGLFSGPMQNLSNAENVFEYASCQSRYGVLNTPAGLFWVSQNQGKIFWFNSGLKEISREGMKWWFAKYLPSNLLEQFPSFDLLDNPIIGIGCMLAYDNTNEILYVSKKDYRLRDEFASQITYVSGNKFKYQGKTITLGDIRYFEDASFTVSYDIKNQKWISFHDWHPDFIISSREHFITAKGSGLWKHNERCDSYCNYYGEDYPFEVEYVSATGQNVSTFRNIEYQLECYKYDDTCQDRFHVLDYNFDAAVIYNTEQISGKLNLRLKPKNDPVTMLSYPIVRQNSIDVLYSKEEQKYRINQFFDITRNRGEFKETYNQMWETAANGYEKSINPTYVNYQKSPVQHKKFRHYMNKVLLKRLVSNDVKMLFRLSNNKHTNSFR